MMEDDDGRYKKEERDFFVRERTTTAKEEEESIAIIHSYIQSDHVASRRVLCCIMTADYFFDQYNIAQYNV